MTPTEDSEHVEIEGVPLRATLVRGGAVGLLALHGGNEGGTAELAGLVARATGATCLVFGPPGNSAPVHIPSTRMAPEHSALLSEFVTSVAVTVSLHGHLRPDAPHTVFLGGGNRRAARFLAEAFAAHAPGFAAVTDIAAIPVALRGLSPANPVNLTRHGGVQVELPLRARTGRPGRRPGIPDEPPRPVVDALITAVGRLAEEAGDQRPIE